MNEAKFELIYRILGVIDTLIDNELERPEVRELLKNIKTYFQRQSKQNKPEHI